MRNKENKIILTIINIVVGLIITVPMLYAISISFMTPDEMFTTPISILPKGFYLGNYEQVLNTIPVLTFLINSFIVSTTVTIGQILTSSLSAYAFVFYDFKGKRFLFMAMIATMMIPSEGVIISNYLTIGSWKMLDSYAGMIIPFLTSAMGIFMIRQFFLTVPREFKEASVIDGCTSFQFFCKILMPVSKPIVGALGIYIFLSTWNQYMWPLLTTSKEEMRTVQIGISMLQSSEAQSFGMILAGIIIILIPSIFIFILGQKQLVEGMTSGAVKG